MQRMFTTWAAVAAAGVLAAPGSAGATVYDQGTVSVSGGLADFDVFTSAVDLPVGPRVFLTVSGGELVHANWQVDTRWQALWWDQVDVDAFVLSGEEYDYSTNALDDEDPTIAFRDGLFFSVQTDLTPHRGLFRVTDHTFPYNVCADINAVPLGQDCSASGAVTHAFLSDLVVRADHDFTWAVTDIRVLPEPSAWVLAILGFGLVGATLRRRAAAAAA